ncbi:MAG: tautomerase family protein [Candidatus Altiarchaeota archaeon]
MFGHMFFSCGISVMDEFAASCNGMYSHEFPSPQNAIFIFSILSYLGGGIIMPVVSVRTWPLDDDMKKQVIEGITAVFTDMNIPAQAVTVIIEEIPKENWGTAGEQHSVKFKNMGK